MPSLQIRNLPDDLYQALSARAKREGRSRSQQAIAELRRSLALEDRRGVFEQIRAEMSGRKKDAGLVREIGRIIRAGRDR